MKCPACSHGNLSDFPFCEQCLELLPAAAGSRDSGAFELTMDAAPGPGASRTGGWPPFPWNPRDLANPLIGRDKALKELSASFAQVTSTWKARVHLLVGQYGMGKSRVVTGLVSAAGEQEADTLVIRSRCPSQGRSFRMWDAVLRVAFDIPADADPTEAGARLAEAVGEHLPDEAIEVASLISHLTEYDVPGRPDTPPTTDAEALIERGIAALTRLFETMAAKRPILLVIENANRAAPRSLALAGALTTALQDRPLMVVLNGSPELTDILPAVGRHGVTRLEPLSRSDADKLLRLFLTGIEDVPKEIGKRILSKAHGNPYAIKSMVRYLREAGAIRLSQRNWCIDEHVAWDLEMPDDLGGVVLAQMGKLPPEDRVTLGRASVIGTRFWLGALVALHRFDGPAADTPGEMRRDHVPQATRDSLERLASLGFVQRASSRMPGVEAWTFRSDVHLRAAQTILPATTHQRFHRVIWHWLQLLLGDRADDDLLLLAHHAEAAGAPGQAARHLLDGARQARRVHHPDEERRLLEAAAALVDDDDVRTHVAVGLDLGDALAAAGDDESALAQYQTVLQTSWRMRHKACGAQALERIGRLERKRGDLDRAYGHLLQALRLFEVVRDRRGVAEACSDLGQIFWLRGDFEQALRFYRKSEDLHRHLRHRPGMAEAVHCMGLLHIDKGDLVLAREYLGDALELRRRLDDPAGVAATLNALGVVFLTDGEADDAIEAWKEALDHATSAGEAASRAVLANNLGECLTARGSHQEARQYLDEAISFARDADRAPILIDALRNLAELHTAQEAWEPALEALVEAESQAERLGLGRVIAAVARSRGELEAARASSSEDAPGPFWARAEAAWRRSATTFEQGGYDLEAATSRERLAEALAALDRPEDADEEAKNAADLRARHAIREVRPS